MRMQDLNGKKPLLSILNRAVMNWNLWLCPLANGTLLGTVKFRILNTQWAETKIGRVLITRDDIQHHCTLPFYSTLPAQFISRDIYVAPWLTWRIFSTNLLLVDFPSVRGGMYSTRESEKVSILSQMCVWKRYYQLVEKWYTRGLLVSP